MNESAGEGPPERTHEMGMRKEPTAAPTGAVKPKAPPPPPPKSRPLDVVYRRLDLTLEAIVQSFKIAAEKGAAAGFEYLADYLDGCDAVQDGDPEAYAACKARLEKDAALIDAERKATAEALREMAAEWRDHVNEQEACEPCAEEETWLAAAGDLEALADSVEQGGFSV